MGESEDEWTEGGAGLLSNKDKEKRSKERHASGKAHSFNG